MFGCCFSCALLERQEKSGEKLQMANTRLRNGLGAEQYQKILERLPRTLSDEVIIRISTEYGWNDAFLGRARAKPKAAAVVNGDVAQLLQAAAAVPPQAAGLPPPRASAALLPRAPAPAMPASGMPEPPAAIVEVPAAVVEVPEAMDVMCVICMQQIEPLRVQEER